MSAPHPRAARLRDERPGGARSEAGPRLLRAAVFAAVCVVLAAAGHTMAACTAVPLWTLGAGFLGVLAVVVPLAGRERSLPYVATLLAVGQGVLHTLFGLGQHTAAVATTTATGLTDAELVARATRLVCGAAAAPITPARAQQLLIDARLYPGATGGTGGTGATGGMGSMQGSMHHAADALPAAVGGGSGLSSMAPLSFLPSPHLLPSLPMALCHLLAALAAGWLLRRGDASLRRLIDLSAHGVAEGACVRSLRAALALVRALLAGLPATPAAAPRPPRTAPLAPAEPRTTALQHSVIRRGPPAAGALVLAA
ncbi:hypothetical protein [Streptomyces sp. Amel2xC10]|uniref:hypothetical protein n=1 Tax=Streptomyces sp. Amel2xC10 TaxID=1305826 RepID=UPI000A08D6F0|nr:hypothetical protein [Streptomyces sp. Amel2xC10]SMF64222.1 hypothetical protein SAMN02745830_04981 [Streptomyces sp. Amel2xC10]